MAIIKKLFTEAPNIIEVFYIILGVSALVFSMYHFLPEEKALKWLGVYHGYYLKRHDYDWTKTLRRNKVFLLIVVVYSLIILLLTYLFGKIIAKVGIWILMVFVLIASFWLNPIKKEGSKK